LPGPCSAEAAAAKPAIIAIDATVVMPNLRNLIGCPFQPVCPGGRYVADA
jgi:hypothetical protein